jgi:hypothetical protein
LAEEAESKVWTLLPLHDVKAKFLCVDTMVLWGIISTANAARKMSGEEPVFPLRTKAIYSAVANEAERKSLWDFAFDQKKIAKLSSATFEFARIVRTDGISASVSFSRSATAAEIADAKRAVLGEVSLRVGRYEPGSMATPLELLEELKNENVEAGGNKFKIVGIDPGARDMITVNMVDEDGREISFTVSTKSWLHDCKTRQHQQKREAWLKRESLWLDWTLGQGDEESTLFERLQQLPTPKTQYLDSFLDHVAAFCVILPHLLQHNVDKRRVRRLRFDSQSRRRAAMDRLCNRIVRGRKDVLVAFGAALPSQGFGYAGKPLRLLRRRLALKCRVVILDEHYTSQVCSRCGHLPDASRDACKMSPARARESDENGLHKELFAVRFCLACNIHWHRDVNAARNMRLVLAEIISDSPGCVRPRAFLHEGTVTPQ